MPENLIKIKRFALFTDVSLNPVRKSGFGARLLVPSSFLENYPDNIKKFEVIYSETGKRQNHRNSIITYPPELNPQGQIVVKKFENTSSTKLEIETVLWGLEDFEKEFRDTQYKLTLYTDSQCVCGLLRRRQRLESHNFISSSKNLPLQHTELYKKFYSFYDSIGFEVIKVVGHAPSNTHNTVRRIFSFLDKEVREEMKKMERRG